MNLPHTAAAQQRLAQIEQARHVRFLETYPGGLEQLMRDHAALIAPKFAAVDEVLGGAGAG